MPRARLILWHANRQAESINSLKMKTSNFASEFLDYYYSQRNFFVFFSRQISNSHLPILLTVREEAIILSLKPQLFRCCVADFSLRKKPCLFYFVLVHPCHYERFIIAMNSLKSVVSAISGWLHTALNIAGNSSLTLGIRQYERTYV